MRTSELRIGNLVECNGKTEEVTGVIQYGVYFGFGYCPNIKDFIKPIPLTEEWLIKFGFGGGEGHYSTPFHNYFRYYKNGNISFFGIKFEGKHKIKYVHQLQNLVFTLTGEELTIK